MMNRTPSQSSAAEVRGGVLQFSTVPVLETDSTHILVDHSYALPDARMLISISGGGVDCTKLVSSSGIEEVDSKNFVHAPEERVDAAKSAWAKRATSFVKAIGYSLTAVLVGFSLLSATNVMKARVVLTGSMVPTINPGDVVITANPTRVPPHIGSIVAYEARRFDGQPVGVFSHRIIGGNLQDGFIVKGDANPSPDIQRPKLRDILGTEIFVIPWIGKFLTKQALFFLIPIIVGVWVALDALKAGSLDE